MSNKFLEKLALLCEQFNAVFFYTTDDDGIHIALNGQKVFVGYLHSNAAKELRNSDNYKV